MVCWGIASRGSSSPFGAKCIHANDSYGSIAASHLRSCFVGLPDKYLAISSNCLRMPCQIQWFTPNTKVLGVYATPDPARLMLLFS